MTLKEKTQGKRVWIGTGKGPDKRLTKEETLSCDDVLGTYNPEDYKSITVPGQSKSIKELMDRYEKGRPVPTE